MKRIDTNLLLQKIMQHIVGLIAFVYLQYQLVHSGIDNIQSGCIDNIRYVIEDNGKHVFLELLLNVGNRSIEDLLSFIYKDDVVAYFFSLLHAVRAENNAAAIFSQLINFIFDEVGVNGVKATKGFIKDNEFGIVQYGGNELQFLLHAFTQVFHFFVPPALH